MTETSLSLIWGVTSDSGRGLDFISKQSDTLETLFILLHVILVPDYSYLDLLSLFGLIASLSYLYLLLTRFHA